MEDKAFLTGPCPLQQEKREVFEVYAKVRSGGSRFVDYYKK